MSNILITGGTGFVGSHMIDYILKYAIRLDQKIYCTKRWMEETKNLDHVRRKDRLEFIDCDLLDAHSIRRAVEISKPEKVFHFAAQSFPEVSFKTPVIKPKRSSAWAQYTVRVNNRDDVQAKLKDNGIPTAVYYPISLHLQECFRYLNYKKNDFPISEQASKEVMSLPMNSILTNDEINYICSHLKS